MANYEFRYRLQQTPEAATDGSGLIHHDIYAIHRLAGSSDPFAVVPGYHRTVSITAVDLKVVMDMPHTNEAQKTAKSNAYRALVATALGITTNATPTFGWDSTSLESYVDANDAAKLERDRADSYITVTLVLSYPVDFSL